MYIHQLSIPKSTIFDRKIQGLYSLHKVVYSQFENIRTAEEELAGSKQSGFVWRNIDAKTQDYKLLVYSDRPITPTADVEVKTHSMNEEFLQHKHYKFDVTINPTKKVRTTGTESKKNGSYKALIKEADILNWLENRKEQWGFDFMFVQVGVVKTHHINEHNKKLKLVTAEISGVLTVTNLEKFKKSVIHGIGRGRTFGCGLLQILPIQ